MSPTKIASSLTVPALKEKLRTLGLSTTGAKNELISRLLEADPAGDWLGGPESDVQNNLLHDEEQDASVATGVSETEIARREMDMLRRERELL